MTDPLRTGCLAATRASIANAMTLLQATQADLKSIPAAALNGAAGELANRAKAAADSALRLRWCLTDAISAATNSKKKKR
jgi:hypothetical protein